MRYWLHSFDNNPQSSGTYTFKNQKATFFKSEAAKRPNSASRWFFGHTNMWYIISFFFWVAESISAMFKCFRVKVAAQNCVKAARTCQKWIQQLKKTSKWYITCVYVKTSSWCRFRAALGLWRPPIWKMSHFGSYICRTWGLWICEGMKSISQKWE